MNCREDAGKVAVWRGTRSEGKQADEYRALCLGGSTQLRPSRFEILIHALRSGYIFPMKTKECLEIKPWRTSHLIWSCNLTNLFQVSNPSFTELSRGADNTWHTRLSLLPVPVHQLTSTMDPYLGCVWVSCWTLTHWVQSWYIKVSLPNSAPRTQLRRCSGSYSDFFTKSQAAIS